MEIRKYMYKAAITCIVPLVLCGCEKKQVELAPVAIPMDMADLNQCEYKVSMAQGAYGNFVENDVRITFFGIMDYTLLEKEASRVKEGQKAVVVGMSAVKLRNNKASIKSKNYKLIDTNSNTEYDPLMVKDNDITQFEKVKEKTVICYRLIYTIPEETDLTGCILLVTEEDGKEHLYSHMAQDEPSDEYVDKSNLCPICVGEEMEETTLVVCECPLCGRQFISGHKPPQQICYACSVMYNRCTQCQRYITSGINKTED